MARIIELLSSHGLNVTKSLEPTENNPLGELYFTDKNGQLWCLFYDSEGYTFYKQLPEELVGSDDDPDFEGDDLAALLDEHFPV